MGTRTRSLLPKLQNMKILLYFFFLSLNLNGAFLCHFLVLFRHNVCWFLNLSAFQVNHVIDILHGFLLNLLRVCFSFNGNFAFNKAVTQISGLGW